jgi:hypothetical protein
MLRVKFHRYVAMVGKLSKVEEGNCFKTSLTNPKTGT